MARWWYTRSPKANSQGRRFNFSAVRPFSWRKTRPLPRGCQ